METYTELTIKQLVEKIKSQEVTSLEVTTAHLELAKTLGKELNAFITVTEEYALKQAKLIDEKIAAGEQVGELAGVPCTIKDVIMTKGIKTTASSQLLANFIAPYSATAVERLEEAGAVIIGKTNSDPFAFGASGENSGFGPTKNPVDQSRVPGGSSSGAAAAQAAGIGMFAIGTDTGGSVRQPASFVGRVGFKPSYGRNSRYGLIAMASSFDTVGVIANTVADAATVEQVVAGRDQRDATTYNHPVPDYLSALEDKNVSGLKIGVPKQYFAQGINDEVASQVKSVLNKFEKAGAELIDLDLPTLEYGIATYYVLVPSEISSNMARFDGVRYGRHESDNYYENIVETRGKYMEDEVKRRVMIGTYALSAGYADEYYKKAAKVRTKITAEIMNQFEKVDVVAGPTSPTTAFKLGEKSTDPLALYLGDVYTVIANIVGAPAISLNCGEDSKGLPIGLQLMTAKFTEDKLFRIANAFEYLNQDPS